MSRVLFSGKPIFHSPIYTLTHICNTYKSGMTQLRKYFGQSLFSSKFITPEMRRGVRQLSSRCDLNSHYLISTTSLVCLQDKRPSNLWKKAFLPLIKAQRGAAGLKMPGCLKCWSLKPLNMATRQMLSQNRYINFTATPPPVL